jgi:hypothetical protein
MLLISLAAICLIGFGLVRGMFPRPIGWSLHNALLLSLGIGAGAGVLSCLYFVALVLAGPNLTLMACVTGAAVVAALAFALLTRRQGTLLEWADGTEVPWYLSGLFLLAIALAAATFLVAVSNNPHGDQGAWSIWNLRARFLFRAGPFWRDAFSNNMSWSHLDYPLLVPGLIALCWELAGEDTTAAPIAIAFLFALGTAGVLIGVLGVLRGKTQALVGGILLLGTSAFIALSAAEYGDVPLSFYILATLALLCLQDRYPDDLRFSALAGLMAGFAAWTRNEGIIFLVAVIVARVLAAIRFRDRPGLPALAPQMLRLIAGLLAPLAVVIFFKLRVGGMGDLFADKPALVLQHLADPARWITTVEGLAVVVFTLGRFLISIVPVLALYWYLVRFQVDARDRAGLTTAGIALGLTLATQMLLDILFVDNLVVEIGTAFERALLQLWPAGVLMLFLAFGPLQLTAPEKTAAKNKTPKKAPKPSRAPGKHAAETR